MSFLRSLSGLFASALGSAPPDPPPVPSTAPPHDRAVSVQPSDSQTHAPPPTEISQNCALPGESQHPPTTITAHEDHPETTDSTPSSSSVMAPQEEIINSSQTSHLTSPNETTAGPVPDTMQKSSQPPSSLQSGASLPSGDPSTTNSTPSRSKDIGSRRTSVSSVTSFEQPEVDLSYLSEMERAQIEAVMARAMTMGWEEVEDDWVEGDEGEAGSLEHSNRCATTDDAFLDASKQITTTSGSLSHNSRQDIRPTPPRSNPSSHSTHSTHSSHTPYSSQSTHATHSTHSACLSPPFTSLHPSDKSLDLKSDPESGKPRPYNLTLIQDASIQSPTPSQIPLSLSSLPGRDPLLATRLLPHAARSAAEETTAAAAAASDGVAKIDSFEPDNGFRVCRTASMRACAGEGTSLPSPSALEGHGTSLPPPSALEGHGTAVHPRSEHDEKQIDADAIRSGRSSAAPPSASPASRPSSPPPLPPDNNPAPLPPRRASKSPTRSPPWSAGPLRHHESPTRPGGGGTFGRAARSSPHASPSEKLERREAFIFADEGERSQSLPVLNQGMDGTTAGRGVGAGGLFRHGELGDAREGVGVEGGTEGERERSKAVANFAATIASVTAHMSCMDLSPPDLGESVGMRHQGATRLQHGTGPQQRIDKEPRPVSVTQKSSLVPISSSGHTARLDQPTPLRAADQTLQHRMDSETSCDSVKFHDSAFINAFHDDVTPWPSSVTSSPANRKRPLDARNSESNTEIILATLPSHRPDTIDDLSSTTDSSRPSAPRVVPASSDWSPVCDLSPILDVSLSMENLDQRQSGATPLAAGKSYVTDQGRDRKIKSERELFESLKSGELRRDEPLNTKEYELGNSCFESTNLKRVAPEKCTEIRPCGPSLEMMHTRLAAEKSINICTMEYEKVEMRSLKASDEIKSSTTPSMLSESVRKLGSDFEVSSAAPEHCFDTGGKSMATTCTTLSSSTSGIGRISEKLKGAKKVADDFVSTSIHRFSRTPPGAKSVVVRPTARGRSSSTGDAPSESFPAPTPRHPPPNKGDSSQVQPSQSRSPTPSNVVTSGASRIETKVESFVSQNKASSAVKKLAEVEVGRRTSNVKEAQCESCTSAVDLNEIRMHDPSTEGRSVMPPQVVLKSPQTSAQATVRKYSARGVRSKLESVDVYGVLVPIDMHSAYEKIKEELRIRTVAARLRLDDQSAAPSRHVDLSEAIRSSRHGPAVRHKTKEPSKPASAKYDQYDFDYQPSNVLFSKHLLSSEPFSLPSYQIPSHQTSMKYQASIYPTLNILASSRPISGHQISTSVTSSHHHTGHPMSTYQVSSQLSKSQYSPRRRATSDYPEPSQTRLTPHERMRWSTLERPRCVPSSDSWMLNEQQRHLVSSQAVRRSPSHRTGSSEALFDCGYTSYHQGYHVDIRDVHDKYRESEARLQRMGTNDERGRLSQAWSMQRLDDAPDPMPSRRTPMYYSSRNLDRFLTDLDLGGNSYGDLGLCSRDLGNFEHMTRRGHGSMTSLPSDRYAEEFRYDAPWLFDDVNANKDVRLQMLQGEIENRRRHLTEIYQPLRHNPVCEERLHEKQKRSFPIDVEREFVLGQRTSTLGRDGRKQSGLIKPIDSRINPENYFVRSNPKVSQRNTIRSALVDERQRIIASHDLPRSSTARPRSELGYGTFGAAPSLASNAVLRMNSEPLHASYRIPPGDFDYGDFAIEPEQLSFGSVFSSGSQLGYSSAEYAAHSRSVQSCPHSQLQDTRYSSANWGDAAVGFLSADAHEEQHRQNWDRRQMMTSRDWDPVGLHSSQAGFDARGFPAHSCAYEPYDDNCSTYVQAGSVSSERVPFRGSKPYTAVTDKVSGRGRMRSDENDRFLVEAQISCHSADPTHHPIPQHRPDSEHSLVESPDSNVMDGGYTIQAEAERKHHSPSNRSRIPTKYSFETKRFLLTPDPKEKSIKVNNMGLKIVGGKLGGRPFPWGERELGAYVAAIYPGTAADRLRGQLHEGDQVLEWNGVALSGRTFEEVQRLVEQPNGEVELVIRTADKLGGRETSLISAVSADSTHSFYDNLPSASSVEADFDVTFPVQRTPLAGETGVRFETRTALEQIKSQERDGSDDVNANAISATIRSDIGDIQLELSHDAYEQVVNVLVLQARLQPAQHSEVTAEYFVKVCLRPTKSARDKRRTKPSGSQNPEWRKSFSFPNVSEQNVVERTLDVSLWRRSADSVTSYVGETLLNLSDCTFLDDRAHWYPLVENYSTRSGRRPRTRSHSSSGSGSAPGSPRHATARPALDTARTQPRPAFNQDSPKASHSKRRSPDGGSHDRLDCDVVAALVTSSLPMTSSHPVTSSNPLTSSNPVTLSHPVTSSLTVTLSNPLTSPNPVSVEASGARGLLDFEGPARVERLEIRGQGGGSGGSGAKPLGGACAAEYRSPTEEREKREREGSIRSAASASIDDLFQEALAQRTAAVGGASKQEGLPPPRSARSPIGSSLRGTFTSLFCCFRPLLSSQVQVANPNGRAISRFLKACSHSVSMVASSSLTLSTNHKKSTSDQNGRAVQVASTPQGNSTDRQLIALRGMSNLNNSFSSVASSAALHSEGVHTVSNQNGESDSNVLSVPSDLSDDAYSLWLAPVDRARCRLSSLGPGQVLPTSLPDYARQHDVISYYVIGDLCLVLQLDGTGPSLSVTVGQCRNIWDRLCSVHQQREWYLKVYLRSNVDAHKIKKDKTQIQKCIKDPAFNEVFNYQTDCRSGYLEASLWVNRGLLSANKAIGMTLISLSQLSLNDRASSEPEQLAAEYRLLAERRAGE